MQLPSVRLRTDFLSIKAMTIKQQSIVPPPFQAWYDTFHFSPATRVGDTIWVSGQVGMGADMKVGDGMQAQAQIAFECLKDILEAAGAGLADVVELMTFHTDLRGEMEAFAAVKDKYFPSRYPSWTAVGVTQLALPELCIEIRAVAVAGSGHS
ncbi:RutC family protein YjgH [Ralstonia sp. LMG 32965]|uniref:RutC family protein YjgH n=2 Tax=Ralstonia flatus TaxID=3058601 RepID=A0ABM9L1D6_9RALS|nr:RidA family protein [Ralstonia sp. LMG 32965]CAJ0895461.1 RutC family protein YjgH [Ralstonia sp. LMG 32965]